MKRLVLWIVAKNEDSFMLLGDPLGKTTYNLGMLESSSQRSSTDINFNGASKLCNEGFPIRSQHHESTFGSLNIGSETRSCRR